MSKSKNPSLLITGATGNVGTELIKLLSAQNISFRAMMRSGQDAEKMFGMNNAEVVIGDFNNTKTLADALEGIERAFLLTNSSELAETQQKNFIEAARQAGVKHIVKLSQWAADAASPVRFLRYHAVVEEKIKESGIGYTFLRPNLFMQGLLGFREPIAKQGKFFAPIGDAKISMVDVRDIAAAAAAALTADGHEEKIYNLTGRETLSHAEVAEKLSAALNRSVQFIDVSPEEMRAALVQYQFPEWQADGLIEDYAHYKRGEAAEIANGVQDATGKQPRSFDDFVRDYAPLFS